MAKRTKKSRRKGLSGFGSSLAGMTKDIPKQVTRPVFFIAGVAGGRFLTTQVDKLLKVEPKADGEKFSIKDDWKQLAAPLANIGVGVGLSTVGAKHLGDVAEFAGYGFMAYGAGNGVKRVFAKDFLGLGEAEFDGTGKTETPASKEEVAAAVRALKASMQMDEGFRPASALPAGEGVNGWKKVGDEGGYEERKAFDQAEEGAYAQMEVL